MARTVTTCPVCQGPLRVSELRCDRCDLTIRGRFQACRFCEAPAEHLGFIETFLRCEGNLAQVERELGLSYPTLRNRLTAALESLGLRRRGEAAGRGPEAEVPLETVEAVDRPETASRRRDLLDALARGDVSAEVAAERLRDLM